jgi:hypothetical protein
MQAVAFPSQPTKPAMSYGARDPDEIERMGHISAIGALLEEIKSRKPSRSELIQVIGTTCGALNHASCARIADAVLALWSR